MNLFAMLRSVLFFLLLFTLMYSFASPTISPFQELLKDKKISHSASSTGSINGRNLIVTLKNESNQRLHISIEPGTVFDAENSDVQNMIVGKSELISLDPHRTHKVFLYTFCTNISKMSPALNEKYAFAKKETGLLLDLMNLVDINKLHASSTSQSAIWNLTNNTSLSDVYGDNIEQVKILRNFIIDNKLKMTHEEVKKVDSLNNFLVQAHHIVSIRTNMVFRLSDNVSAAHLVLIDTAGRIKKTFFENRPLKQGVFEYKFGFNQTAPKNAKFSLVLLNSTGDTLAIREVSENTKEEKVFEKIWYTSLHFDVKDTTEVNLKVENQFMELVDAKKLPKTFNPGTYHYDVEVRYLKNYDKNLNLTLHDANGNLILEKKHVVH